MIDRFPGWKIVWHHAPSATTTQNVEDAIHHFPQIYLRGRPPVFATGMSGARIAHCLSVRSLGYSFRCITPVVSQHIGVKFYTSQTSSETALFGEAVAEGAYGERGAEGGFPAVGGLRTRRAQQNLEHDIRRNLQEVEGRAGAFVERAAALLAPKHSITQVSGALQLGGAGRAAVRTVYKKLIG